MKKVAKLITSLVILCILAMSMTACSCAVPQWLGGPHTVTTVINGEEISYTVEKDTILVEPEDPTMEGYDFVGWFLDEQCSVEYKFDQPFNEDTVLYAKFIEKEYTITFTIDGIENEITYKWSQTPSVENPKKDGFVFKAWCLDEALTESYEFTAPVKENLTVYAKFAPAYKVQYVITDSEQSEIVETENETIPIKPKDPVVEGYNFEGWFLDQEFTVQYNFDSVLEPETTIYAKLVEKEYKVTYMVGGTETMLFENTYKYFSAPTEPATPEYQGQYFFGWYLDAEFKNSYDFSYSLKTDSVIYAQFLESKPIYTIEELQAIKDYPAGNYTLQNNLIFSGHVWQPVSTFSGKLDGNGFKLIGLTLSCTDLNAGFIQTNNGTIKNLTIENYSFVANNSASYVAGALVGTNNGTIENCHIINLVSSYKMEKSEQGNVTYKSYLGGMVGKNNSSAIIKNSSIKGNADISQYLTCADSSAYDSTAKAYAYFHFGGVVGQNEGKMQGVLANLTLIGYVKAQGKINFDCYAYAYLQVGGLVSNNLGEITKCGFSGSITSQSTIGNKDGYTYLYLGGVARGNFDGGKITETFAKGSITETAGTLSDLGIGGFMQNNSGEVKDCYSDMTIKTNTASAGGSIGGFVSVNCKTISTSYAKGSINATTKCIVGGFIATNAPNGNSNFSLCSVDIITTTSANLGVFVGQIKDGSTILVSQYDSEKSVVLNGASYTSAQVSSVTGLTNAELISTANLKDTLYWNTDGEIWVIDGENLPSLAWEKAE
ncbi:MAG: hypothetical protein E7348_05070 [Clostridiales bacterium]|nr:hypothetical protein [Clostridiales bacterium]